MTGYDLPICDEAGDYKRIEQSHKREQSRPRRRGSWRLEPSVSVVCMTDAGELLRGVENPRIADAIRPYLPSDALACYVTTDDPLRDMEGTAVALVLTSYAIKRVSNDWALKRDPATDEMYRIDDPVHITSLPISEIGRVSMTYRVLTNATRA